MISLRALKDDMRPNLVSAAKPKDPSKIEHQHAFKTLFARDNNDTNPEDSTGRLLPR